ncbi:MAG: hypothetical protein JXB49_24095 [Bacteroidales bacterium]|nr:hypothetical protein [Bacteroidales bacterium]
MKFVQIIKIKPITGIILLLCVMSCKEPEEYGFLSDNIVSKVDTIFIERGISTTSQAPFYDLSTRPYHFSIVEIRTEDNTVSTQMTEEKEVRLWTDAFIPREDTTEAQVMAKLVDTLVTPVIINPLTGIMQFTTATKYVDEADVFNIDLNVSNIAGEKELKDYVVVKLSSGGKPFEVNLNSTSIAYVLRGDEGKAKTAFSFYYDNTEKMTSIEEGTADFVRISKLSDEPTVGVKVYFQFIDKNGNPFQGDEILLRPWNGDILPHYGDNSVNTIVSETELEFNFPMVPWPAANYMWDVGLSYYISENFPMSQIDTTALFSDPRNSIIPEDRRPDDFNEYIGFYLSIRTGFRILTPGTWRIEYRFPFITKD